MDIEEFYEQDERRRRSDEVELGMEWHDSAGVRYELSWIADTGELYLMREPAPGVLYVDPYFGEIWARTTVSEDALSIATVGWIPDRTRLEQILSGWQGAMADADSLSWLAKRLSDAGVPKAPPGVGATS